MEMCGANIWMGATTFGRNLALGLDDLNDGRAMFIRRRIDSQPGYRMCWEANEDNLRLWGYGNLVDTVSNLPQYCQMENVRNWPLADLQNPMNLRC
jgi:hypothetical protein